MDCDRPVYGDPFCDVSGGIEIRMERETVSMAEKVGAGNGFEPATLALAILQRQFSQGLELLPVSPLCSIRPPS